MLTRKQHELLVFINERLKDTGVSPSFDEMKEALDLRSKSGIHRLISGLEERGFIRRLAHRARALEVLRLPENSAAPSAGDGLPQLSLERPMTLPRPANVAERPRSSPRRSGFSASGVSAPGFSPKVIKGDFRAAFPGASAGGEDVAALALPLYGRIAAGTPIEALRDPTASIDIPVSLLSGAGEHYALEVAGDSMIDAGILDGDTVIVQRCDTAENGAIIVALVDDAEVTLKRLRRKGASIALEPANQSHETRIFGPDRVKVQGRMVGLFRRY